MLEGVWPSLFAKRSASLAPDCCSRKCVTRKRPRRAAKCSKVSWGFTSAEEAEEKSERTDGSDEDNRVRRRALAPAPYMLGFSSSHRGTGRG